MSDWALVAGGPSCWNKKKRELGLEAGLATAGPSKRPQNGRNGPAYGPTWVWTWVSIENNKKQNK